MVFSEFVQKDLSEVYFDVDAASKRYKALTACFHERFGSAPEFFARSPGRINIIGEHIDYSFFPCLPAAIAFDMVMAVRVVPPIAGVPSQVEVVNLDTRFEAAKFEATPEVAITGGAWSNYFKCSWITGLKYLTEHGLWEPSQPLPGLQVAISGNVPTGGGLSSSAAFVVTGTLVTLYSVAPGKLDSIDRKSLTKLSATCEQLVGVNSGGMDQAASVFGQKDHAVLVSFRPDLSVRRLQFPARDDPIVFLIANSLVVSNKLETGPIHYNLRVVEVTVAANVLAEKLGGLKIPQDGNLHAGSLYGVLAASYGEVTVENLRKILADVEKFLDPAGYTKEEASSQLNLTVNEFETKFTTEFPVRFDKLKLYQRAKHVFEETIRVLEFVKAMEADAAPEVFGDILNASQVSAMTLYENSHEHCDKMCEIARKAGSLGSRVTGAGWGGCTVHLTLRSKSKTVREALQREYYDVYHPDAPKDALVESRPSGGTAVFLQPSLFE